MLLWQLPSQFSVTFLSLRIDAKQALSPTPLASQDATLETLLALGP